MAQQPSEREAAVAGRWAVLLEWLEAAALEQLQTVTQRRRRLQQIPDQAAAVGAELRAVLAQLAVMVDRVLS
tara:strand:+ start:688 stop:903 length:216 start_codon:yes stop_codon:yes gene_type:complete